MLEGVSIETHCGYDSMPEVPILLKLLKDVDADGYY